MIFGWTWVPEDTSTQATSAYIRCKHWMCRKIKTTVFFTWPAYLSTDISSSYCSDFNLFLVDYACCKLCNIWLLLFESNYKSYHYTGPGAWQWRKNIVVVITQDCRLLLLAQIIQYISNWSKVLEHLPTLFSQDI